jgi:hypothetical protein
MFMIPSSAAAGSSYGCWRAGWGATAVAQVTGYSTYWIG